MKRALALPLSLSLVLAAAAVAPVSAGIPITSFSRFRPVPPSAVAQDSLIRPGEGHFAHLWQLTFGGQNAEAYWSGDGTRLTRVRPARIDDDRAIPQSARPKLHSALKPTHHRSVGDITGRALHQLVIRVGFIFQTNAFEFSPNILIRELRPGVRTIHHKTARPIKHVVVDFIADPYRCPAISGGRLNVHSPEGGVEQNLAVDHRVVGDSAGKPESVRSCFFMEVIEDVETDFFEPRLKARGYVAVAIG